MASTFDCIPTIDLSLAEDPAIRPALLKQLHHALTSVGFLYVANHGVPAPIVDSLIDVLPTLFGLSHAEKQEIALCKSPHFLGYSGVGAERTGGKEDGREQVEFATELKAVDVCAEGRPLSERLKGPNQVCSTSRYNNL